MMTYLNILYSLFVCEFADLERIPRRQDYLMTTAFQFTNDGDKEGHMRRVV